MRAISAKSVGVAPYLEERTVSGLVLFLGNILRKEGRERGLTSPCTPSLHFQTFAPRLVHW